MRIRNGFQFTHERFGELFVGNNRVEHLAISRGPPASLPERSWVDSDICQGLGWHAVALDHAKRGEQVIDLHREVMSELNLESSISSMVRSGTTWRSRTCASRDV